MVYSFGQYCQSNFSVSTTDQIVGYVYYNDGNDFRIVDNTNSTEVPTACEWSNGSVGFSYQDSEVFNGADGVWRLETGAAATTPATEGGATLTKNGNPTSAAGYFGRGVDFDGSGDYYDGTYTCPSSGGFTMATWINMDGNTAYQRVISCSNSANNDEALSLFAGSGSGLDCFYRTSGGSAKEAQYTGLERRYG